jgi:regulator of sirC expression with transglutaminase-like and TPR domain
MARAAAKRRQPTRHHHDDRRHKDSGGQRFEDTLFFSRLRKRAKWVFIFLALAFGLGFVLFGVGSSVGGGGGLSDIFNGIRGGGSGQASVEKAQKATQKDPKDATAWRDLATAYEAKGENAAAISAWTTYTTLRPKDADGLQSLASAYEQQFSTQTQEAAAAQAEAQNAQATNFGPPATSPLGRALGSIQDPIGQAVSATANQRFNDALSARQATAQQLVLVYKNIATLHKPAQPSDQLLLAQAAQNAGDAATAVAAYKKFVQLAPDDPNAAYARQQIKALGSGSQG